MEFNTRFDAVVGMPHFDQDSERNYFKENGSGDCFIGSASNPIASLLIPEQCKAPSRFVLVAGFNQCGGSQQRSRQRGKLGFLLLQQQYETDPSGTWRPQRGRFRRRPRRNADRGGALRKYSQ